MTHWLPPSHLSMPIQELREKIRCHHWRRYFLLLRIEAAARRDQMTELADQAKAKALYHRRLAESVRSP